MCVERGGGESGFVLKGAIRETDGGRKAGCSQQHARVKGVEKRDEGVCTGR